VNTSRYRDVRAARRLLTARICWIIGLQLVLVVAGWDLAAVGAIPGVGGFRTLYEADSIYHHIVVAEDAAARYLRFDRSFQSGMYLHDGFDSPFLYAAYAHLGLIFQPKPKAVLVVGLGGGSIPKRFWRDYPDMMIEVAELDPMVVEVAKQYFGVREDARFRIAVQDGRVFLRKAQRLYDMIIVDAYFDEAIPFHLTTREFLAIAKSRLGRDGVIVFNMLGALTGPHSRLFRAMYRTVAEVFPGVYTFPTAFKPYYDGERIRNIIVVGSNQRGLTRDEILQRARRLTARVTYRQFLQYAADYFDELIPVSDVPSLTDDYAPVDTLLPVFRPNVPTRTNR
jgi:spermidine synthase